MFDFIFLSPSALLPPQPDMFSAVLPTSHNPRKIKPNHSYLLGEIFDRLKTEPEFLIDQLVFVSSFLSFFFVTFAFERVEVFVFLNRSEYLFDNTALCLLKY